MRETLRRPDPGPAFAALFLFQGQKPLLTRFTRRFDPWNTDSKAHRPAVVTAPEANAARISVLPVPWRPAAG
ncbi:hypothetical protein GCM10027061_20040 [Nesterenkonia suensis]